MTRLLKVTQWRVAWLPLIDADTNKAKDGVIEMVDDHTVRLNLPTADITLIPGFADYPAAVITSGLRQL